MRFFKYQTQSRFSFASVVVLSHTTESEGTLRRAGAKKSLPAIFILLFTINQYRKERNFQEEYAFKSAVALTIDAYSKTLTDPANRDKLILDAVLNVFKTPIEEKFSDRIKTKTALDTIKELTQTTQDILKNGK